MQTISISFPNRCLKSESELTVFGFLAYLGTFCGTKKKRPSWGPDLGPEVLVGIRWKVGLVVFRPRHEEAV